MFERILQTLTGSEPELAPGQDGLQVAVAALLVEAGKMDDHFDDSERATIRRILAERFKLSPWAVQSLLEAAERAAENSTQLYRFTHMVCDRVAPEDRVRVIEMMWEVAYADGVLDPIEDALIRRVAGLLYVSDKERGDARLRILEKLGLPR